jgi:putative chitinase
MSFKFNFTEAKLRQILVGSPHVDQWFLAIEEILPDYEIDTPARVAAWLGQTAHESGGYRALRENLNYSAEGLTKVFPRRFPALDIAQKYNRNPEKIGNKIYADRMGNGPESSGDGYKYHGRGAIQLTGHDNYKAFANSVDKTIDEAVKYCETLSGAIESACWFWNTNKLNQYADSADLVTLTKRINGGTLGLDDRVKHYNHNIDVLA